MAVYFARSQKRREKCRLIRRIGIELRLQAKCMIPVIQSVVLSLSFAEKIRGIELDTG